MKIGLHIADFTFPNGPSGLAPISRAWSARRRKVPQVWEPERIALFQREVIPAAAEL